MECRSELIDQARIAFPELFDLVFNTNYEEEWKQKGKAAIDRQEILNALQTSSYRIHQLAGYQQPQHRPWTRIFDLLKMQSAPERIIQAYFQRLPDLFFTTLSPLVSSSIQC